MLAAAVRRFYFETSVRHTSSFTIARCLVVGGRQVSVFSANYGQPSKLLAAKATARFCCAAPSLGLILASTIQQQTATALQPVGESPIFLATSGCQGSGA